MTNRRAMLIALSLAAVMHSQALAQTTAALSFVNAAGEPVRITRAQLLVTAWGVSEQYELPFEGHIVHLDLSSTRPTFADNIADTRGVIYVKADGYTPILSQPFAWPKDGALSVIDFRNQQRMAVTPNMRGMLVITMRRPIDRRIRLLDVFIGKSNKGTVIQRGRVAADYGQPGGGVEVLFKEGTKAKTVTGPDTIPS